MPCFLSHYMACWYVYQHAMSQGMLIYTPNYRNNTQPTAKSPGPSLSHKLYAKDGCDQCAITHLLVESFTFLDFKNLDLKNEGWIWVRTQRHNNLYITLCLTHTLIHYLFYSNSDHNFFKMNITIYWKRHQTTSREIKSPGKCVLK